MIKRALAAALCLMLVFALLPKTALADETYTLEFRSGKLYLGSSTVPYDGENVTWSGNGNTLTLTNFHFTTSATRGLYLPDETVLVLKGTNTVTVTTDADEDIIGISCSAPVTFSGDGTLIATASRTKSSGSYNSYGIWVSSGNITVDGSCSITGSAGLNGQTSNCNYGIYLQEGDITVNGGSITGKAGSARYNSQGVTATNVGGNTMGNITVGNGSITGIGGTAETQSFGVFAFTTIKITDGSLIGVSDASTNSCGISVPFNNGAINLNTGAIVLAKSGERALSKAPTLTGVAAWGSTSYDGSGAVPYVSTNNDTYKYFRTLATIPALQLSVSPQPIFPYGQAPGNETVTVSSTLLNFNASNHFDSATMDGRSIDLGTVGSPGAHGSVSNGSIVIQLNKAYLDTLPAGTHTLRVNLAGVYTGDFVEAQITVLPSGDGTGGAGDDVPKTGDSATPMLWLGIALLTGMGLAVSAVRRKRQNG